MVPACHCYGWIPDIPDQRDRPYAMLAAAIPELPKKIDLRRDCTPVEDQGQLGSCTAQALVGNLEFLKKSTLRRTMNFSRLFVYYNERVMEHTVHSDAGAQLRDGIKCLVKTGACLEKAWPYKIKAFTKKPPDVCYRQALKFQITSYYRLSSVEEMRHTLAQGFPFVFGFAVYESLETADVNHSGIIPMPQKPERLLGGHAMLAVGYDDVTRRFFVRNSWGKAWGDKGYGTIPYAYLANPHLAADFWTIRNME